MNRVLSGLAAAAAVLATGLGTVVVAAPAHATTNTTCRAEAPKHRHWCTRIVPIGHRAREYAPDVTNENTLVALAEDRRLGVDFETDMWNLAAPDGTPNAGPPVIIHDPTIRRTVDPATYPPGIGPDTFIGQITPDQWTQLRTKGGERLPTAQSWLQHAAKWGVDGMVDVKYAPVDPESLVALTKGTRISFYGTPHLWHGQCLQTGMTVMRDAGARVGLKVWYQCPISLPDAAAFGYRYVIGPDLTQAYADQAHSLGLKVGNYDSGNRTTWARLVRRHFDYVIAPRPAKLMRWLHGGSK